jgi:selenide,water dikinase
MATIAAGAPPTAAAAATPQGARAAEPGAVIPVGARAGLAGDEAPALTSLAAGAGCGCKLPAAELLEIVRGLPEQRDERLLVGAHSADDAAVYRVSDDLALVQTIDFFTPLVDDPYDFGRIAAANALSDIYAMGATPVLALNVVAFPLERLGGDVLREVLRGGMDVVGEAGAVLAGGHSIEDPEPKYGLAVTGTVDPARMMTNAGGQPGDALVLTKPLGTGAIVAAAKRGRAKPGLLDAAVAVMTTLNAPAAQRALAAGAHAVTDVTGFGLLGHLHNLALASGLAARLAAGAVPFIEGARQLLEGADGGSGGARRNAAWAGRFVTFADEVPGWRRQLLVDPTTSGGLLVAVDPVAAGELGGSVVGRLVEGTAGTIEVR